MTGNSPSPNRQYDAARCPLISVPASCAIRSAAESLSTSFAPAPPCPATVVFMVAEAALEAGESFQWVCPMNAPSRRVVSARGSPAKRHG